MSNNNNNNIGKVDKLNNNHSYSHSKDKPAVEIATYGNKNNNNNSTLIPKITVKSKHSLYHLVYSEISNSNNKNNNDNNDNNDISIYSSQLFNSLRYFNVMLYIDIPTIDYYMDELKDIKLSKFNRKFKLNKLKMSIWNSFTNNNLEFWKELRDFHANNQNKYKLICSLSIYSSGSLRYVETTKFLIETFYEALMPSSNDDKSNSNNNIIIKINLYVSSLSLKWFNNFLNKKLLNSKIINFINISHNNNNNNNNNNNKNNTNINNTNKNSFLCDINTINKSPFKEYFTKLNEKFNKKNSNESTNTLETIIIITNSTGIKALLTILSDKPLTNFIDQNSINQLYNINKDKANTTTINKEQEIEEKPLKRESSFLLDYQNNLLTSNKDKSVRVRSLSINRKSSKIPLKTQIISNHKNPLMGISRTKDIFALIDDEDRNQQNEQIKNINDYLSPSNYNSNNNKSSDNNQNDDDEKIDCDDMVDYYEDGDYDDDDEEEDDDDFDDGDDDDDDEGISFYVPSLLSRSNSGTEINSLKGSSPRPQQRTGRFRSLSLMDPEQRKPFILDNPHDTNDNYNDVKKGQSFTNIYVHDGDFNDTIPRNKSKRKYLYKANNIVYAGSLIDNDETINNNHNIQTVNNGLIPPEFYSRISTPMNSAHSSATKLDTISNNNSIQSPMLFGLKSTSRSRSSSQLNLFERSLINKSFEMNRYNNSNSDNNNDNSSNNNSNENIFSKLINKRNQQQQLFQSHQQQLYHGNHHSSFNRLRALDEEDRMLGSFQEKDEDEYNNSGSCDDTEGSGNKDTIINGGRSTTITPTTLNIQLYDSDDSNNSNSNYFMNMNSNNTKKQPQKYKTSRDNNDDPEIPKHVSFKRIPSINLYDTGDTLGDKDDSTNDGMMWVLGRNQ